VVTRLESPSSGTVIEGRFSLGWMGRLTREQLDLVGLLLARRNNAQQLAADLGIAYNTVRSRFDDIVEAVGQEPSSPPQNPQDHRPSDSGRRDVLRALADGELTPEEALAALARDRTG
jgi:hypothetical protein